MIELKAGDEIKYNGLSYRVISCDVLNNGDIELCLQELPSVQEIKITSSASME